MVGGALLRIGILFFSLSLVPRNLKNDVGFGLAVFSWTNIGRPLMIYKNNYDTDLPQLT